MFHFWKDFYYTLVYFDYYFLVCYKPANIIKLLIYCLSVGHKKEDAAKIATSSNIMKKQYPNFTSCLDFRPCLVEASLEHSYLLSL